MKTDFPHRIIAKTYESTVYNLTPEIVLMHRNQKFTTDQAQIDAYGDMWMLAFADLKPNQLFVRNRDELTPIVGPWGIWVGNFSMVEWRANSGEINWQGITSFKVAPPEQLLGKVIIFPWNMETPKDAESIFRLILDSDRKIEVESQRVPSAIALKTKRYIEKNFSEVVLIQTVAEKLNLSWAVMTREFKRSYGISPIEYRHKLRVFMAVKSLSTGFDVTSAMAESGFTSASQFFAQFKKHVGTQPNSYHYKERAIALATSPLRCGCDVSREIGDSKNL